MLLAWPWLEQVHAPEKVIQVDSSVNLSYYDQIYLAGEDTQMKSRAAI